MSSSALDLISNLGSDRASQLLAGIIADLCLTDEQDDPPFRRYIGSKKSGLALLFNQDKLIDIQFFIKPTASHKSFSEVLPYGLIGSMRQEDDHLLLGTPEKYDATFSKYRLDEGTTKLVVEYGNSGAIRYVSVSLP